MKLNNKFFRLAAILFFSYHDLYAQVDYRRLYEQCNAQRGVETKQYANESKRQNAEVERLRTALATSNNPYWKNQAVAQKKATENEKSRRETAQAALVAKGLELERTIKALEEKIVLIETLKYDTIKLSESLEKLTEDSEKYQALINGRCACCAETSPDTIAIAVNALEKSWSAYRVFVSDEKNNTKPFDDLKKQEKIVVNDLWKTISRYKAHMDCKQNIEYIEFLHDNRLDVRSRLYKEDTKTAYNILYPVEVFTAIQRGFSDYDCRQKMVKRIFPNLKEYLEGIDETPEKLKIDLRSAIKDYENKQYAACLGKIVRYYSSYRNSIDKDQLSQIEYCYGTILLWNLGNVYALKDLGVLNSQLDQDLKNPKFRGKEILRRIIDNKEYDIKIRRQAFTSLGLYY